MIEATTYLLACALATIAVLALCCAMLNARVTRQRRLLSAIMHRHGHRIEPGLHEELERELRHD